MSDRRRFIGGLLAACAAGVGPARALAGARPGYGGHLRLTMPIDTSRLDPHASALTSRLLGAALFEGLFARSPLGAAQPAYPTLAAALPKRRANTAAIELRPGLRSGRGVRLDAAAVVESLQRSRLRSHALAAVERIRVSGPLELEVTTDLDPTALALELARPACAIVPPGFDPAWPDCTGALRSLGPGIKRLVRSGWAPRGGSYLDEVSLTSADLRTCLRDFETLRSDACFLASGLHQGRSSARTFALGPLGYVALLPGSRLGRFAAPGVLAQALGSLNPADFSALGLSLLQSGPSAAWIGPPCSILVEASEPWLVAIAEELARAWDSPRARVRTDPVPRAQLDLRQKDRDFDCALVFLGLTDPNEVAQALYGLAALPPPKRSVTQSSLEDAVRHLPPALLGRLVPHGYCDAAVTDLTSPGAFDLANARFSP